MGTVTGMLSGAPVASPAVLFDAITGRLRAGEAAANMGDYEAVHRELTAALNFATDLPAGDLRDHTAVILDTCAQELLDMQAGVWGADVATVLRDAVTIHLRNGGRYLGDAEAAREGNARFGDASEERGEFIQEAPRLTGFGAFLSDVQGALASAAKLGSFVAILLAVAAGVYVIRQSNK